MFGGRIQKGDGRWRTWERNEDMDGPDRMPMISVERMTEAQKQAHDEIASGPRGAVYGPFVALLRSPDLMRRVQATGEYLRYRSALPRRLSEFVILIVARQWTQQVEWSIHLPIALEQGVRPEIAEEIAQGRRPSGMSDDEENVYEFCRELRENRWISDRTYERAKASFGEQGIIDLIGLIGYYSWMAMLMNAARTAPPEGRATLEPLPG